MQPTHPTMPTPTMPASAPQPEPPPGTHERGYTLQTLIVTAIATLLAVMAAVLVVAVTTSAADDLAGTPPDIQTPCQPWEIHDLTREAAGVGGGKPGRHLIATWPYSFTPSGETGSGGVTSSAIGCFAPCYLKLNDYFDFYVDTAIQQTYDYLRNNRQYFGKVTLTGVHSDNFIPYTQGDLKYDTSNRNPDYYFNEEDAGRTEYEVRLGVVSELGPNLPSDRGHARNLSVDTYVGVTSGNVDWVRNRHQESTSGYFWDSQGIIRFVGVAYVIGEKTEFGAPVAVAAPPVSKLSKMAVKAVVDARACDVYHTVTGEVLASSDASRVGRVLH